VGVTCLQRYQILKHRVCGRSLPINRVVLAVHGAGKRLANVDTRSAPPYPLAHMNHNAPRYAYYYGYFT